jgi:hypothetical protein
MWYDEHDGKSLGALRDGDREIGSLRGTLFVCSLGSLSTIRPPRGDAPTRINLI